MHTPPQCANMEHSIHSERPMVQTGNSPTSQDGLMMPHHSDHSESVTYQSMATIEPSVQTALISKIQWKIL
jgi:hypothetical protein